jgi:hypothetical protein
MAKPNLSVVSDSLPVPGVYDLGEGRIRVVFDIAAKAKVKIRSERELDLDYRNFVPEGLALQFDHGKRVYNDAIGAIKPDDKKEDGTPYYPTEADFLNEVQARAQKKLDAFQKGDGGRMRLTDELESEMLKQGFSFFQLNKWTLKSSPVAPDSAEFSQSKDYGEFKERVQAYVKKYDALFREDAQEALDRKAKLDAKIKAMAAKAPALK